MRAVVYSITVKFDGVEAYATVCIHMQDRSNVAQD